MLKVSMVCEVEHLAPLLFNYLVFNVFILHPIFSDPNSPVQGQSMTRNAFKRSYVSSAISPCRA